MEPHTKDAATDAGRYGSTVEEGVLVPKGLKRNAVGLFTSTAIGMASTAPAYSLAATVGFVVAVIGLQSPLLVILAFIPMVFSAWATMQMNRADPDCGTSFIWAARALGPRTGWWAGGWGTIAADLLGMASYAQVAGQYVFLLLGLNTIGQNASSVWVLLVGMGWIVGLTYICYRGIEVSARVQVALVTIEVVLLLLMSIVALIKLAQGSAPPGHLTPSWSWFDPGKLGSFSIFMQGMLLMVFIYWGWDTTTSINEESDEPSRIPGTAGVLSTVLLLITYLLVVISVQAFAGIGTRGIGLGNANHQNDALSVLGGAIFGHSTVGTVLSRLLIFMVLTSAAATTQTTILPNARTTLSMAFHKAIPAIFGRVHPRYLTPTFSTLSFAAISIAYYAALNFLSHGNVISDAVTAATFFVAVYLGITAVACAWQYRKDLSRGLRAALGNVIVPAFAAVFLFGLLAWSVKLYLDPSQSYVVVRLPLIGQVGGTLLVAGITALIGLVWMVVCQFTHPGFFRGEARRSGVSLSEDATVLAAGGGPGDAPPQADGPRQS
ncbi:MAG: APC family permease [Solirubrobacterales bacterium]|nr:APC family permease [Solirubrobacterales bacterium]